MTRDRRLKPGRGFILLPFFDANPALHRIDRSSATRARREQQPLASPRAASVALIFTCMDAPITLSLIVGKYLDWCRRHRAPRSVEWYKGHLDGFLAHLGDQ